MRSMFDFPTGMSWLLVLALVLGGAVTMTVLTPQTALAQEEGGEGESGEGESDEGTSESSTSALNWVLKALGIGYSIAFLFLSFMLVALFVMNILALRRDSIVPLMLVETFEAHLKEKRYQEAFDLAKNDDSFLGRVLAAGLGRLQNGYAQAIEAMQEVGETENMKLEHRLSYIALIGTVSPMVGLLGTVHGMVNSFSVIATSNATPSPSKLAEGISTALITTMVGLIIAIPAIAAYNILKNRAQQLVLEAGIISEQLMGRFQNVGKK